MSVSSGLWILSYKLGLPAQVPFLTSIDHCPFVAFHLRVYYWGFCLLAFSFVPILHCGACSFSDLSFLSVLLPALLGDLSFTVILLSVLSCDDINYPHDFPTVSAPSAIDISMR